MSAILETLGPTHGTPNLRIRCAGCGRVYVATMIRRQAEALTACRKCVKRPGCVNDAQAIWMRQHARMTHAEIGRVLGLSRARVQQIEASALAKLRAGLEEWR